MKMRGNICCCLVAFVLSCNVTAAIIHKIVEEKNPVTLSCPHSVEGKVTWSRERDGHRVDILTADGGSETRHIKDPGRRYGSQADKSLYIGRVNISDTGRYLCNNEPAVELTVIPSGTTRRDAAEKTTITLKCPPDVGGSDVPTWSRDTVEIQQQRRFHVSPADNTLIITDLQPADSGLYYCDGKPAVYLTVSKGNKTPTTTAPVNTEHRPTTTTTTTPPPPTTSTTTTTTTTPPPPTTSTTTTTPPPTRRTPLADTDTDYLWQMSVRTVLGILFLITMISITVIIWRKARQIEKRHTETETDL